MVNRTALKTAAKIRMAKAGIFRLIGYTLFILAVLNVVSVIVQLRLPELPTDATYEQIEAYISAAADVLSPVAMIVIFVYSLFSSILQVGYTSTCLKVARGYDVKFSDLFDGFGYGFKIILLQLLMGLIVGLGMIFFFIPGIILSLAYSQAFYILIDDPDISVIEALRRSRQLMNGNKMDFFVFNLSYIGWYLLSSFFILGDLWVQPYVGVGSALYYDHITGKQIFHLRRRESGEYEFYAGNGDNNPFEQKPDEEKEDNNE